MNQHVSISIVVSCNGSRNADNVIGKQTVIIADAIGTIADGSRIKVCNDLVFCPVFPTVSNNGPIRINDPDIRLDKLGKGLHLGRRGL